MLMKTSYLAFRFCDETLGTANLALQVACRLHTCSKRLEPSPISGFYHYFEIHYKDVPRTEFLLGLEGWRGVKQGMVLWEGHLLFT